MTTAESSSRMSVTIGLRGKHAVGIELFPRSLVSVELEVCFVCTVCYWLEGVQIGADRGSHGDHVTGYISPR